MTQQGQVQGKIPTLIMMSLSFLTLISNQCPLPTHNGKPHDQRAFDIDMEVMFPGHQGQVRGVPLRADSALRR